MARISRRTRTSSFGVLALAAIAVAVVVLSSSRTAQAAPRQVTGGSMSWGIKASFRSYIVGPIATGAISVGGGAQQTGDGFLFPVASGSYDNAGTTTVSFNGSVHFTGHAGQLDMTLSNFRATMSASSKIITVDLVSKAMNSGAAQSYPNTQLVSLAGGNASETASSASWASLPATLTAGGVTPFAGFYTAGTAFDPVTINLNLAGTGSIVPTSIPGAIPTATFIPGVPTPYTYVYGSGATVATPVVTDSTIYATPVPGAAPVAGAVGGLGYGTTTTTTTITNGNGTSTTTTTTTGGGGGGPAPVAAAAPPPAAYSPVYGYGNIRPPSTGDGGLLAQ